MTKARQLSVAVGICTAAWLGAAEASASDSDDWFGRDKALHFGASAILAGGGYALGTGLSSERWKAFALGGGVAIAAGALKEGLDAAGLGTPSWRDFTWDVAGTAVGLGIAYAVDSLVRSKPSSSSSQQPVRSSREGIAIFRF